jgi:hypothetical protein
MIIDFKSGEEIELVIDPNKAAILEKPGECLHYHPLRIDEVARTCTCTHCGKPVDIFTAILRLVRHYETRIDSRVKAIAEFDERERLNRAKRLAKRNESRESRMKRRDETLEHAAYNEYQAKLLTIRAQRQRILAAKIDIEDSASLNPNS